MSKPKQLYFLQIFNMNSQNSSFEQIIADINEADIIVQNSDVAQMLADVEAAGQEYQLETSKPNKENAQNYVSRYWSTLTIKNEMKQTFK